MTRWWNRSCMAALALAAATLAPVETSAQPQVDEELRAIRAQVEPLRRGLTEERAREEANKALVLARTRYGEEHVEVARSLEALAALNWYADNLPEEMTAISLQSQAVAMKRKALGGANLEVALSLEKLAEFCLSDDREDLAERHATEALAIREKLQGNSHPDLADTLALLGNARASRAPFLHGIALREKALGAGHRDTAISFWRLGVHAFNHREADAEKLLLRALPILENAAQQMEASPDLTDETRGAVLTGLSMLEAIYEAEGRSAEATAMKSRLETFMSRAR